MKVQEENWGSFLNPFFHPERLGFVIFLIGSIWIAVQLVAIFSAPVCSASACARTIMVTIEPGSSLREIGDTLASQGLIKNSTFFVMYVRLTGQEKGMQAGLYRMSNSWPLRDIVKHIKEGSVVSSYRFTIPEGFTTAQIENLLVRKGIVDRELFRRVVAEEKFSFPFLEGISDGPYRLEGFLFPDTYEVQPGDTEEKIVRMMLERFAEVYTQEMQQRAEELGFTTREVVTLASIVEREAKLDCERPVIAAVFLNRLRKGMRLESCATVQYILDKPKETLTYKELQIPSPYNTYLHCGLPPGPIANPGLASLKAVLYPAEVDYLYFVARGDGSHYFSTTLREHTAAARRYQGN
jgi:UPF0755 protein